MVGVHIQAEGPLSDIAARRALLRRLLQLPLQRADDRQRDDDCSHSADQQRAAAQRIHQRKNQRRDAENAGEYGSALQKRLLPVGGHVACQLAGLAVDG